MEGNKDESLKCLHLATKFLASGHKEKAKKFAEKSIRLFPSSKAEDLLRQIESEDSTSNGAANHEHARRRRRTNSGHREIPEPVQKNYTPEQVDAVTKIKKSKDYYEVLGVTKLPSVSELKKAYRKLALQFHPDKNQAPGATDAFKRISAAFETLKDPEKKQRYDTYGENAGPTARRQRRSYYEDEFEGDISPEDIFNMFFGGGGFPNGNVNVRRGRRGHQTFFTSRNQQNQQNENVSPLYPLVQILPVLLIILFSLLSSFLIPEPDYSFQRTSQYRYIMTTDRYHIKYFVKDPQIRSNKQKFDGLEFKIEREFIETLQVRCYRERQYKAELHHQAQLWGSQELSNRANNYHTQSCDDLNDLKGPASVKG